METPSFGRQRNSERQDRHALVGDEHVCARSTESRGGASRGRTLLGHVLRVWISLPGEHYLLLAWRHVGATRFVLQPQCKEFIMDKTFETDLEQDLQLLELGDAKTLTMGPPLGDEPEDNPTYPSKIKA